MELIWIPITIFAALMQAVRTAGQKTLNQTMSTMGTTYVRSLFGLPVMVFYLAGLLYVTGAGIPEFSWRYLAHTAAGASAQVLATALLIQMFALKNFAVGTMATKTDIAMTAVIGTLFFSETITGGGWLAIGIVFVGVALMLVGKLGVDALAGGDAGLANALLGRPTQIALACALFFTFSYLFLRAAVLDLGTGSPLWRGAWTVVVATTMQVVGLGVWLAFKERKVFAQIRPNAKISAYIGLTSALGSIGWYTAFAMQNASYVRAVGQIEAVFTLLISWAWFREKISALELAGILVTVAGVVAFRLVG